MFFFFHKNAKLFISSIFFIFSFQALASECDTSYDIISYGENFDKYEKLEALENFFYDTLSQADECVEEKIKNTNSSNQSSSSINVKGQKSSGGNLSNEQLTSVSEANVNNENIMETTEGYNGVNDNGKVPNDIPPANGDTLIESQLRTAAMQEDDPAIRDELWNNYRKYKGLKLK